MLWRTARCVSSVTGVIIIIIIKALNEHFLDSSSSLDVLFMFNCNSDIWYFFLKSWPALFLNKKRCLSLPVGEDDEFHRAFVEAWKICMELSCSFCTSGYCHQQLLTLTCYRALYSSTEGRFSPSRFVAVP